MKKRAPLITVTLFLVASAIAAQVYREGPYLHHRIVQMIEHSLAAKASVASVQWRWLPAPAVTITQLRAESDSMVLVVPTAHLILSPRFFLSGSGSLLRAQLVDPDLLITRLNTHGSSAKNAMPLGTISIKNGTLHLPGQPPLSHDLTLQPLSLTHINGTLSAHADRGEFTISASSNFAQLLHLNGSIDLPEGTYQIDIAAAEFDSGRLFSDQSSPSSLPRISKMTFTSHLEGLGPDHFTIHLSSKDAPFTLQQQGQIATVAAIDGTVSRHNDNFAIDINELSLLDPRLNLSGRVSRQHNENKGAPPPEWFIDLKGTEIDLAALRSAVITRFPSNPIAQKVCGIVNGGSALTARYTFKGELADFHHLQAMKIWAEAKDVPVIVPGIELVIDRASGPISIIDGQLSGENLSADIDKSHGENGNLLLDLRHDHHAFTLDLDLTADLKNLKGVLTQVVHSPRFQQELSRFTAIDGLAKGHLHLGDDLHHLQTNVDVISMQAKGRYNRLPWPFTITAGTLTVAPQEVEWREVQGSIGKQRINRTQGSVDWYDGIELDLAALDADLDLETLFDQGSLTTNSRSLTVQDFFRDKLDGLAGKATLANTSFWGQIGQPEQWHYYTKVSATAVQLAGPAFPKVTGPNVQGEISQDQLRFTGIFSTQNQELFLDGQYTHHLFDHWHGGLTVDGDIGQQLGEWIQARQLIPTALFPNLPFRLEKFTVSTPSTSTEPLLAQGTIISLAEGSTARLQLEISRQPDLVREKLTFVDGTHSGTLSYLSWPLQENHSLLTWQGELALHTFNQLFPQHLLADGSLQGSFTRLTKQESVIYNGEAEVTGVNFGPESLLPDVMIDTLHLTGDSHGLIIDQADLTVDKSQVHLSGNLSDDRGVRTLDLTVTAPTLSSTSLKNMIEKVKQRGDAKKRSSLRQSINGRISFTIDSFNYARTISPKQPPPDQERPPLLMSIAPFKGVLRISPDATDLDFDDSRVCALSINGTWHLDNKTADNVISFSSGSSPLYFEQALPCLGLKQSLIFGPFVVAGEISGRPHNWNHGTIALSSQEGLIKRMNLLSEIFTAVNFTDYFTWQDLPNVNAEGLAFNNLTLNAHIKNNTLILDKTSIKGKGVNLTGRGSINLSSLDSDLTFFIAPFKMVDSIVTGIPLIGKALGGAKESILTFPVRVTGNIKAPEVTSLAPQAVGTAAWELLIDTLTLPYRIFQPTED